MLESISMALSFAIGCLSALLVFLYSTAKRYYEQRARAGQTRLSRLKRVASGVVWHRVALTTLAGGVITVVAYHGIIDVLNAAIGLLLEVVADV